MLDINPLFDAGHFKEAEALARHELGTTPGQLHASLILGKVLLRRGALAEAEEVLGAALSKTPRQPDLLNLRGLARLKLNREAEALDDFDRAIDIRLNHQAAHENLCALLAKRHDPTPRYSVTVITPSIGSRHLRRAIASVQAQSYPYLDHLVVADGPEYREQVRACLPAEPRHQLHFLALPYNVGADGFLGHRVYGSAAFLANSRYVAFLDEDNWFEPDHVASLMAKITAEGLVWAYALRKIVDADGRYICNDDCESLGQWPMWNKAGHLVDTSCYMLRRDAALVTNTIWYRRFRDEENPDFALCRKLLKDYPRCGTNGRYSVNYRAGSSQESVQAAFFIQGNEVMRQRYGEHLPWRV
jgi:Glycosyl transferase family 2/Tetratricopeptide repeat